MKKLFFLTGLIILIIPAQIHGQRAKPKPPDMTRWVGKYPDRKFYNQPLIRNPLRRILSKEDFASIDDHNLVIPIKRVGDYLLVSATIKYSTPRESLDLAFNLKDNAVYIVFWKGDDNPTHRKFSTKNNQFNLPDEVLEELGLKEE
jgi:hypothetical protein